MPQTVHSPPQNVTKPVPPNEDGSEPNLNQLDLNSLDRDALLNITKRIKRAPGLTASAYFVESKIDDLRSSQDDRFDFLTSAVTTLIEQVSSIKNSLESMSTKYDSLLTKVDTLEKDTVHYRTQIQSLEGKLEAVERKSNSSSLEIRNIPKLEEESKEKLSKTIKEVITIIGSNNPLEDREIRDIHRNKSNAIIVDFTTTARKQQTVSKYKEYNKDKKSKQEPQLNTQNLGLPGPTKPIFISDHLTTRTGYLFFLTRKLVREGKLAATWTTHGNLYVKKREGDYPARINDESDLENILTPK